MSIDKKNMVALRSLCLIFSALAGVYANEVELVEEAAPAAPKNSTPAELPICKGGCRDLSCAYLFRRSFSPSHPRIIRVARQLLATRFWLKTRATRRKRGAVAAMRRSRRAALAGRRFARATRARRSMRLCGRRYPRMCKQMIAEYKCRCAECENCDKQKAKAKADVGKEHFTRRVVGLPKRR